MSTDAPPRQPPFCKTHPKRKQATVIDETPYATYLRNLGVEDDPALDYRTTEEIEEGHDEASSYRVRTVAGLPARPGTIR